MALRRAAFEIVLGAMEEWYLEKSFWKTMDSMMEVQKAIRVDGARARLRRIGRMRDTLVRKAAEYAELVNRRNVIITELAARRGLDDGARYLQYMPMSDLEDPENEFYDFEGGNFDLRHEPTLQLEAQSEVLFEDLLTLGHYFGCEARDYEDPDYANRSMVFPTLQVWVALP